MFLKHFLPVLIALTLLPATLVYSDEGSDFFENKVRPLLAKHCTECHGPKKQESGLRLDSRVAILRGGDRGAAAAPGDMQSLLLTAVRGKSDDLEMPPEEGKLPPAEVAVLEQWVKAGLPWGDAPSPEILTIEQRTAKHRQQHWAYQPVSNPLPPATRDNAWSQNAVDRFVLAKLEAKKLTPSPAASKRQLIRRATFDLTGLPPTPAEVEAFVRNDRPDAYANLIDRLLASPQYGERWSRHWLDVARYADTQGYGFGGDRRYPYAYTFRNYVIDAFNVDKPFDRFIVEQLAADRLGLAGNAPELAALGFLTVGREYRNRSLEIDDQIDVATRGFLGLTVACARCHDHKYDGIPAADYYSLYGIFASSKEPSDLPLIGDPRQQAGYKEFQQGLDKHQANLDRFLDRTLEKNIQSARMHAADYLARVIWKKPAPEVEKLPFLKLKLDAFKRGFVSRWQRYVNSRKSTDPVWGVFKDLAAASDSEYPQQAGAIRQRWLEKPRGIADGQINPLVAEALEKAELKSKPDVARWYGELIASTFSSAKPDAISPEAEQLLQCVKADDSPVMIDRKELNGFLSRAERNEKKKLESKLLAYQVESPHAPPRAMVLQANNSPHNPRIHLRGDAGRPGANVPRQFLGVLEEQRKPYRTGGRLELANAIASPGNPLTARVIVNRVWMHHFGQPLVTTPADFGIRSDPPSHPLLLDYLATGLMRNDWSLKWLHREMMLSATYQQQSTNREDCRQEDPENRLLWRMNRRRLEFEALRDAMLAVSGRLDFQNGGRPARIFSQPGNRRRSVYAWIDRQDLPGLLRSFDFASPDQTSPRRPRTTTPQQALFFMNSPFAMQQASALVATLPAESNENRVRLLYQRLFSRQPEEQELAVANAFLQSAAGDQPADNANAEAWTRYAHLLLLCNEFIYID